MEVDCGTIAQHGVLLLLLVVLLSQAGRDGTKRFGRYDNTAGGFGCLVMVLYCRRRLCLCEVVFLLVCVVRVVAVVVDHARAVSRSLHPLILTQNAR